MIRAKAAEKTPWCKKGHLVAWEQFSLPTNAVETTEPSRKTGDLTLKEQKTKVVVTCETNDMVMVIDKHAGRIAEVSIKGMPVIIDGPRLNVWRGPLSNDGVKGKTEQWHSSWKPLGQWCNMGIRKLKPQRPIVTIKQSRQGNVTVDIEQVWSTRGKAAGLPENETVTHGITHRQQYTLSTNGLLMVRNTFDVDQTLTDLPRIGVLMTVAAGFDDLTWFGHGPGESYDDRKVGMPIGLYHQTVTEQYVPYIVPQEHGNHVDTRYFTLSNGKAKISVSGKELLSFNASHFTPNDLTDAYHTHELRSRPEVTLCIDAKQRGLGTRSCGPDTLECYRVRPGRHRVDFVVDLISQ